MVSLLGSVVYHPSLTVSTKLNIVSSTEQTPESFCFFFFFFSFFLLVSFFSGEDKEMRDQKKKNCKPPKWRESAAQALPDS